MVDVGCHFCYPDSNTLLKALLKLQIDNLFMMKRSLLYNIFNSYILFIILTYDIIIDVY
jgi:hypothetical protein